MHVAIGVSVILQRGLDALLQATAPVTYTHL